jgi:hypothetical protein
MPVQGVGEAGRGLAGGYRPGFGGAITLMVRTRTADLPPAVTVTVSR